jgi:hypothetical protein
VKFGRKDLRVMPFFIYEFCDNLCSIGDNLCGIGDNLCGIGDSLCGIGDNLFRA